MSPSSELPLLLDPQELQRQLGAPGLRVVDLSPRELFERHHVPGSVHLPYAALVHSEPPVGGLMPAIDALASTMATLGIGEKTHVVALDAEGGGAAGRLIWTLEALGHRRVSLLDGGLGAWLNEGYPVEAGSPPCVEQTTFVAAPDNGPIADADYIQRRLDAADFATLDARSWLEFTGAIARATRGGHIPDARHYEWTQAMDRERNLRLRPLDTVRAELVGCGITPEREVVVYCHTHHRSAFSYALLRILGYPAPRGYPGSWSDWGNRSDTPVETSATDV
jgi:thiosulfate/3-mercaptopyruvate sulfurtransferase